MKDLFGNEIDETKKIPSKGYARTLYVRHYRKATHKIRRCKYCKHCVLIDYHSRNYYKCALIGDTRSGATDIRISNVCDLWDMKIDSMDDIFTWLDTLEEVDGSIIASIKTKLNEYENTGGNP
jgi:hypothetical protein